MAWDIGFPMEEVAYPTDPGDAYSADDDEFTRKLHGDLQNKGVRCWFAPKDMKIGGKIREEVHTHIRLRDKLVLVLSEASVDSK